MGVILREAFGDESVGRVINMVDWDYREGFCHYLRTNCGFENSDLDPINVIGSYQYPY